MKYFIVAFAATSLLAGALFTGCASSSDEGSYNSKQEAREARAEYRAEWRAFKKDSEEKIDANQVKIDAFKAKMDNAGPERRAKYADRIETLEQKNRNLRQQLADYKDRGPTKWQEFKSNFKHDMDGIGDTMSDLFKSND